MISLLGSLPFILRVMETIGRFEQQRHAILHILNYFYYGMPMAGSTQELILAVLRGPYVVLGIEPELPHARQVSNHIYYHFLFIY